MFIVQKIKNMKILEIKNLSKSFGELKAVKDISFQVEAGEMFALLGPNGAGKSTIIKILTTLLHPDSGVVTLNGNDLLKEKMQVRKSFGIVFQDPSLDDELTAMENLDFHGALYGMSKKERIKKAEELLKFVELWERRKSFVKEFSGGMKRRLEIARGLMHQPKIFFLDEPTQGLDPQTRNHMWEYLKNMNREAQTTIFFTTHYMEEAEKYATRIAIVDQGQIIAQGSPEELKKQTGKDSLEDAFLTLTGKNLRVEEANSLDKMRQMRRHR